MAKNFNFIGFVPNGSLTKIATLKLGQIFMESPSDSSTVAQIKKTIGGFEGILKVRSAVGEFVAHVVEEDPMQVVEGLFKRVRAQLNNWKANRNFITGSPEEQVLLVR